MTNQCPLLTLLQVSKGTVSQEEPEETQISLEFSTRTGWEGSRPEFWMEFRGLQGVTRFCSPLLTFPPL